jgi:hypothetical protein
MRIDPRTPVDELTAIARRVTKLQDQINALKAPSGTSAYQSVSKLQALINDIQTQLDDYIANGTYNKAQIDAMRASSPGAFTVNGALEVNGAAHIDGNVTTDALFVSPAAYSTIIGATRHELRVDPAGRIGSA